MAVRRGLCRVRGSLKVAQEEVARTRGPGSEEGQGSTGQAQLNLHPSTLYLIEEHSGGEGLEERQTCL